MALTKNLHEVLVRPLSPVSSWFCTSGMCQEFATFIIDRKADVLVCDKHLPSAVSQALRA